MSLAGDVSASVAGSEPCDAVLAAGPRGRAPARRRVPARGAAVALDAAALVLAAAIAVPLGDGVGGALSWAYPPLAVLGLHGRARAWDVGGPLDGLRRGVEGTGLPWLLLVGAGALLGVPAHPGGALGLWGAALALLGAGRLGLAAAWRLAGGPEPRATVIVGAGTVGLELARRLAREPRHGLRPLGFVDVAGAGADVEGGLPLLGDPEDIADIAARTGAECVAFAFSSLPDMRLIPVVRRCEALGLEVLVVPRLFETVSWRLRLRYIGSLPLGELRRVDPDGLRFALKHAIDRAGAALGLLLLGPLMLAIALSIRLGSPGPVLFRQRRVGRDGREFTMLKFRTMWLAAEPEEGDPVLPYIGDEAPGGVEGEDRRTRLGVWLRRLSLDELPQLVNVLRGEMSLVGPRPERPDWVRQFTRHVAGYDERHRVRSGITGLAQVHGLRGNTSVRERIELDNFYIENWSLWLDLKIVLLTLPTVLSLRAE